MHRRAAQGAAPCARGAFVKIPHPEETMAKKNAAYTNESITMLKGADLSLIHISHYILQCVV